MVLGWLNNLMSRRVHVDEPTMEARSQVVSGATLCHGQLKLKSSSQKDNPGDEHHTT